MADFSYLVITPFSGELSDDSLNSAASSFRPAEAICNPHRIEVHQLRYRITSRIVLSKYCGALAVRYPEGEKCGLLFTLPGRYTATQLDPTTLAVSVINFADCEDPDFRFWIVCKFDSPITLMGDADGKDGAIRALFAAGCGRDQVVRFGTSFISLDQARLNLSRESDQTLADFEANAAAAWNNWLRRIEVTHRNPEYVDTFYHNMYRAGLFPQVFYELDPSSNAIHYDTTSRQVKPGILYTNNGFWDTFRTVYPLYSLIAVEEYTDMLKGFLQSYRNTGYLPKWLSPDERGLMPGTLVDCVIADAAVKGIADELLPEFLEAMIRAATVQSDNPHYGRHGAQEYLRLGYVPLSIHESVNHTLDYALSDYCIAVVADRIGKHHIANEYRERAHNYRNLFEKESKFMRARDANGEFRKPFRPIRWGEDYAEGSAWQTSWSVLHDFAGLIGLYDSPSQFTDRLVELFNQPPSFDPAGYGFEIHEMSEMAALEYGQFAISNQPSFHYPYLAAYVGRPWLTTPLIRAVLTTDFDASSHGYPGDEDNGTMAAWYIFSSLGFYPVTPGSGQYVIGIPLWDIAQLHLSSGNTLTITAQPNQAQHVFVDEVTRDGQKVHRAFFTHHDLIRGGLVEFKLGVVPHLRTYSSTDLPFSMSTTF